MFNYYLFILDDKEYVFYTTRNLSEDEVIEWVKDYSFINSDDISKCHSPRKLSCIEVKERNKILYQKWYNDREKRKALGEDVSYNCTPPTISAFQLD